MTRGPLAMVYLLAAAGGGYDDMGLLPTVGVLPTAIAPSSDVGSATRAREAIVRARGISSTRAFGSSSSTPGSLLAGRLRADEPPVYNRIRGLKATALEAAVSSDSRETALAAYRKDIRSSSDTSSYALGTWDKLHSA